MNVFRALYRFIPVIMAAALGGCLISEKPLLDESNGRATPIAPGLYDACQYDGNGGEPDCKQMQVSLGDDGQYGFLEEDEDETTFIRFRRISRMAWLAQLNGEDEDDYYYFLAETEGEDFVMAMVVCEDIPEKTRSKLVARKEMEIVDKGATCVAKTLHAAIAATNAYRKSTSPDKRSHIVYRKRAEEEQD